MAAVLLCGCACGTMVDAVADKPYLCTRYGEAGNTQMNALLC